ncbi:thiamine pyrophosphate-binding protein [Candidatus Formimonas warabiya]|uniref:Sulfopyruvate decarboxylase n=1 Tax=Formimonas warabiya TaxID=1761012 RepID=A0A3G1KVF8_FORW1|nr:thiamine pyrophosphate-binding protein [Candidatus Formimonas warabiya]ATW26468.1 sulfopyruvate decarboxylase [Candidatus Formimonas warabiya]
MREEVVELVVDSVKKAGIKTIVSLPESKFKELYPVLAADKDFNYIMVTNEGEGVSIAAGAWLAGKKAVMIMENAGLRVATEPLARLGLSHGIPVMMIMCYTGDIGERNWWGIPHGITMEPLLQAMRIPYIVVRKTEDVADAIVRAAKHINVSLYHVAVILTGDVVA